MANSWFDGRQMVAVVLTLAFSALLAGVSWLVFGARLRLDPDADQNDRLNLLCYFLAAVPVVFVIIFFAVEHL